MILNKILNFFLNPIVALLLLLAFCIGFFLYNYLVNNKTNNFFSFGPTKDINDKPVTFLGSELNTWGNVIVAYILIFTASLFINYYNNVVNNSIFDILLNQTIKKMTYSKALTYLIVMVDPFMQTLLYIIAFYATATFQIQYILPQFFGAYIMNLPYILNLIHKKKFV